MTKKNKDLNKNEEILKKEFDNDKNNDSVVFINTPIQKLQEDVLGIHTYIKRINKAIKKGANIIGIIGDYGSGKSSLIELLKKENEEEYDTITINLWGNKEEDSKKLTQNFLYQMSLGVNNDFSKYISKKINNNYGILSFATSKMVSIKPIIGICIGLILFVMSLFLPIKPIESIFSVFWMNNLCIILKWLFKFMYFLLYIYKYIFGVIMTGLIINFLKNNPILFSLWDSQGKVNNIENDLFELYEEVSNKLIEGNKKRIIIIEDLDRYNDKEDVKKFISEIYKFNSLVSKEVRNKLFFIIEIKSEESLNYSNYNLFNYADDVYKKIFLFKINLNPIHNDDVSKVLENLLKQEGLNNCLDEKDIKDPYIYIIKGENLNIRDIKERLNRSFEIYENLKFKASEESKPSIDFIKCSIVAYLESEFPADTKKLLTNEEKLVSLLESAFKIRQDYSKTFSNINDEICSLLKEYSFEFGTVVSELITNNLIDDDFRMYFYNYPKGQSIKTLEEIYCENLILYPKKNTEIDNEKINITVKNNPQIIIDCMERRKREKLRFPISILKNENLLKIACEKFSEEINLTICSELKVNDKNIESTFDTLDNIYSFSLNLDKVFTIYLSNIKENIKDMTNDEIISIRKRFLKYDKKYHNAVMILYTKDMPMISYEEINYANEFSVVFPFIDYSRIDNNFIEFVIKKYNRYNNERDNKCLLSFISNLEYFKNYQINLNELIGFLNKNKIYDNNIFKYICEKFRDEHDIELDRVFTSYINDNVNKINSMEELELVNCLNLKTPLEKKLLKMLRQNNLLQAVFVNNIFSEDFDELQLDTSYEVNKNVLIEIKDLIQEKIVSLRNYISNKKYVSKYNFLFFEPHERISIDEMSKLKKLDDIINCTEFKKINSNEIYDFIDKINSFLTNDFAYEKVISIFDTQNDNSIIDKEIAKLAWERLKWKKSVICRYKEKEKIYNIFSNFINFDEVEECLAFSKKVNYLFKKCENTIFQFCQMISNYNDYIDIINEIDTVDDIIIQHLNIMYSKNLEFPLGYNILTYYLENKFYKEYVISKTMREKVFEIQNEIDFEVYYEIFNETNETSKYMLNNKVFLSTVLAVDNLKYICNDKKSYFFVYCNSFLQFKIICKSNNTEMIKSFIMNYLRISEKEQSKYRNFIFEEDNNWMISDRDIVIKLRSMFKRQEKGAFSRMVRKKMGKDFI